MQTAVLMTGEELLNLPEGGKKYELVKGELIEKIPSGGTHSELSAIIVRFLLNFIWGRDFGKIFGAETGFYLARDPDIVRAPDVAFMTLERWQAQPFPEKFLEGAPDLAVEIVSPNDRADEIRDKIFDFFDAGCRLIWVVYPRQNLVVAHFPDGTARTYRRTDTLDGGEVLPGFTLELTGLFPV